MVSPLRPAAQGGRSAGYSNRRKQSGSTSFLKTGRLMRLAEISHPYIFLWKSCTILHRHFWVGGLPKGRPALAGLSDHPSLRDARIGMPLSEDKRRLGATSDSCCAQTGAPSENAASELAPVWWTPGVAAGGLNDDEQLSAALLSFPFLSCLPWTIRFIQRFPNSLLKNHLSLTLCSAHAHGLHAATSENRCSDDFRDML